MAVGGVNPNAVSGGGGAGAGGSGYKSVSGAVFVDMHCTKPLVVAADEVRWCLQWRSLVVSTPLCLGLHSVVVVTPHTHTQVPQEFFKFKWSPTLLVTLANRPARSLCGTLSNTRC